MINKLRDRLSAEDRAVSPVIGVILMVAITVILAAVIGSFVLGIGGNINETPQVRLEVSDADETLDGSENDVFVIQHNGGAELTDENLQLRVADDTGSTLAVYNGDTDDPVNGGGWSTANGIQFNNSDGLSIGVGASAAIIEFSNSGGGIPDGSQLSVTIVHKPSDSILVDQTITVT